MNLACRSCGQAFNARRGARTCSERCRKARSRARISSWERLGAELRKMGEVAAQARLESDGDFRAYALSVLGGRDDAHPPVSKEYPKPIGIKTGELRIRVRQMPVVSQKQIDTAAETGDWSELAAKSRKMLDDNRDILNWRGYGSGQNPQGNPLPLLSDDPRSWS